jgi:hypothetical protein
MELIIKCPHCEDYIIIKKINCGIFRHGVVIKTGKQMDPHACKKLCDHYSKKKCIYGCGKPYQIIEEKEKEEGKYTAIICDYI